MTRLFKCHTQSVWLGKQRRKKSRTYLRVNVNDNRPRRRRWCDLSWLSCTLILINTVVVLIIQDDNENIIVAYRTASSMIMSLAVAATLFKMLWGMTTFWKRRHTVFSTAGTTIENQHTSTLNQNDIYVQQSVSPHLIWCDTALYKQNIHIRQRENGPCLRKVSVLSELLLVNKENWINIHSCKNKSSNICIVKNEGSVSCQLWDTYLYNIYIVVVVAVAAELVVWESVLKYSIKKGFTYKRWQWRSWRRKKKRFEVRFITHPTDS